MAKPIENSAISQYILWNPVQISGFSRADLEEHIRIGIAINTNGPGPRFPCRPPENALADESAPPSKLDL